MDNSWDEAMKMMDKLSHFADNVLAVSFEFPNYVNNRMEEPFQWSPYMFPTLEEITKEEAEILYRFRGDCFDWNCNIFREMPMTFYANQEDMQKLKNSLELFASVGSDSASNLLVKLNQ